MEPENEQQAMFEPVQFTLNSVSVVADSFEPDIETSEEV